jgi:hypothetical protein
MGTVPPLEYFFGVAASAYRLLVIGYRDWAIGY